MYINVRRQVLQSLGLATLSGLSVQCAFAAATGQAHEDAWTRPARQVREPRKAVLLAAAMAGVRIVAVGERGIVLLSDDGGLQWRQAQSVPVSVTLTAVKFVDSQRGFAIGHAGIVLGTSDAGNTWKPLLTCQAMTQVVMREAKQAGDTEGMREAERMASLAGADRPLLDIVLQGDKVVWVVGAYGLLLRSVDAGASWQSFAPKLQNPKMFHLYALRNFGERSLVIAGEQGVVFRSDDAGETFKTITSLPYKGSFFTLELPSANEMLVAGLRGNVWSSADAGISWAQTAQPIPANITGSAMLPDRSVVLSSQAGVLLTGSSGAIRPLLSPSLPPLNAVLPLTPGKFLVLSVAGPLVLPLAARLVPTISTAPAASMASR